MNAEFSHREPSPADEPDRAPVNPPAPDFMEPGRTSRRRRKRQKRSTAIIVAAEAQPRESGRRLYRRALTYFFSSFAPAGHKP